MLPGFRLRADDSKSGKADFRLLSQAWTRWLPIAWIRWQFLRPRRRAERLVLQLAHQVIDACLELRVLARHALTGIRIDLHVGIDAMVLAHPFGAKPIEAVLRHGDVSPTGQRPA